VADSVAKVLLRHGSENSPGPRRDDAYHTGYAIAIYLALCSVITLIATALMPDYTGKDVSTEYDA